MATSTITPPPGYKIETAQNGPVPPPGYTIEDSAPQSQQSSPQPTEQPGIMERATSSAGNWLKGVAAPILPPQDHKEELISTIGGPTALPVYRLARSIVDSVENTIKAPAKNYQQAKTDLQRGIQDFKNGDYRNLASDVGSGVSDVVGGTVPGVSSLTDRSREISEGARPGGDLTTPLVKTGLDAAAIYAGDKIAGDGSEESGPPPDNPVEAKASKVVSKTNLPAGREATGDLEVKQSIAEQNAEAETERAHAGVKIQGDLQGSIRDYWNKVAEDHGVTPPDPNVSIREAGQQVGDNVIKQAKEIIKPLDDATGGKFSENDLEITKINQQLKRVTSIDDEDKLISAKQRLLWNQDDLLALAKKAGVPDNTLENFRAKYRAGQAIYDQNQHIRMTTTGLAPEVNGAQANPETVKSGNLLNRLSKDYTPEEGGKPGRLVQAGGEENAHSLLNSVSNAKVAENELASTVIDKNPEFSTLPSTESKALRELVRPNVNSTLLGPSVDYKGVLKSFDAMNPAELKARFSNPEAIRSSLVKAQAVQRAIKATAALGAAGAAGAAGKIGWDSAH